MATNPRPTTEFHITYGALNTPETARTLNPVLIAPRYAIHSYEDGYENAYLGLYVGAFGAISAVALTGDWPGKTEGATIDTVTAAAYVKSPVVKLNTTAISGTVSADVPNKIVTTNSLVKGVGTYESNLRNFSVSVGDIVAIKIDENTTINATVTGIDGERNSAGAVIAYNVIYVNTKLEVEASSASSGSSGSAEESVSLVFASNKVSGDYVKIPSGVTFASSGITVSTSVSLTIGGNACDLVSGDVYIVYRELLTDGSLQVVASSATGAAKWAGIADPRNPMGMLYAAAAQVTDGFFYMVACAADIDSAYVDAVNYAAQFEDLYAFVTYEDTPAIYAAKVAAEAKYSNPLIAQFKKVWYAPTMEKENVVYAADSNNNVLTASIDANSEATLSSPGDAITGGVVPGDYMVVYTPSVTISGEYTRAEYLVVRVEDSDTIILDGAPVTALSKVEFVRKLDNAGFARKIAAVAAGINSARVNMVWCAGNINVLGFSGVKPTVVAAILATMRSALPPHAPMSGLGVTGVTLNDVYKFTEIEYEILNEGGVWVVSNNSYGVATNYHQITTLTDGTVAEEDSCVSAGDAIVRELRNALAPLANGSANVTDQLLEAIDLQIAGTMAAIMGRVYSDIYGPLVIGYEVKALERPESNNAAILLKMDIDTPQPLLKGQFYFNIM